MAEYANFFLRQISEEEVNLRIEEAHAILHRNPTDIDALSTFTVSQLFRSWGIRGENTPEYAEYLGYLSGKDLYPDFKFTKFEDYVKEVLEGKVQGVYQIPK